MSDDALRELERTWRGSDDPADETAYLRQALQVRHLTPLQVQTAAYLGHPPAINALDGEVPAPPDPELDEGPEYLWGEGFFRLAQAFDPEPEDSAEDPSQATEGGDTFFQHLRALAGGRSPELEGLLDTAQAALKEGQSPANETLTQILYLATSKPVVETLGDEVSAIMDRLLNFASYEAQAAPPSPHDVGPVGTRLVERFGIAIGRRLVGWAENLSQTSQLRSTLEREGLQAVHSLDWAKRLDELALLHLLCADHALREDPPEWGKWLPAIRENLAYGYGYDQDPVYGCLTTLASPADVVSSAAKILPFSELQAVVRFALVPVLLRYGSDPLVDLPLPWNVSYGSLSIKELMERDPPTLTFPEPSNTPELKTRRFEREDAGKFWEVTYGDAYFAVRSGKIGAKGSKRRKHFRSPAAVFREVETATARKLNQHFVEVESSGG